VLSSKLNELFLFYHKSTVIQAKISRKLLLTEILFLYTMKGVRDVLQVWRKNMDLFEYMRNNNMDKESPLASRLRPATLDEVVGQSHIIGKDKLLYRAIKADKISSIIFYGPPGTGKTTLARVIAGATSAVFTQINATSSGKKDMEEVVQKAKDNAGMYGKKTILFIDEIHRFNKGQQDYLLPFVEDGTIILVGATTENPYFEVNSALLSRSIIFELKPLEKEDIKQLILRAIQDEKKGMGAYRAEIDDDALDFLADMANGDARAALNAIELGILTTERAADGKIHITLEVAGECIQKRVIQYDKTGDNHYDTISAFIKSMRGSDPDATLYYLARMIYAGESVTFIARRIMICASEDVSNADPNALVVATAAAQAVERIGMPESRIILAQAAAYVACAPKSNSSIIAIDAATNAVQNEKTATIPTYLMDAHYKGAAELGHGLGYQYAHNFKNHYVKQQYLPDELKDRVFYTPSEQGYEKIIGEHLNRIRKEAEE
jgi:putative ATPase